MEFRVLNHPFEAFLPELKDWERVHYPTDNQRYILLIGDKTDPFESSFTLCLARPHTYFDDWEEVEVVGWILPGGETISHQDMVIAWRVIP